MKEGFGVSAYRRVGVAVGPKICGIGEICGFYPSNFRLTMSDDSSDSRHRH